MSAPLYVREGSRFVPLADTLLRDVPPIPTPVRVPDVDDNQQGEAAARYYRVPAPRCSHGHFARWAAKHCRPCRRTS